MRLAEYSDQNRYVSGRTFYLHDDIWIDEQVQQHPKAPKTSLEFGSQEYYKLLSDHPEARPWLALGPQVTVLLNDRIYEIRETPSE